MLLSLVKDVRTFNNVQEQGNGECMQSKDPRYGYFPNNGFQVNFKRKNKNLQMTKSKIKIYHKKGQKNNSEENIF